MDLGKLTAVLVILGLMPALLITPVMAQEPVTCETDYTVQEGDRLQEIAEQYYGDKAYYKTILEATNTKAKSDSSYATIENPSIIWPGWKLCLPKLDKAEGVSPQATGEPEGAGGLSMDVLENMEYKSEWTASGAAKLVNGKYEEEAAPGAAGKITVELTPFVAYGTLNGQDAAAVVTVSSGGGSGSFYDVAVVMLVDGKPTHIDSAPLEDRADIKSIAIADNKITVEMTGHGPDDGMCCPTQEQVRTFELKGNQLQQTSLEVIGSAETEPATDAGESDLTGTVWLWQSAQEVSDKIIVTYPNRYRLEFLSDGAYQLMADCNRGSGKYTVNGNKLTIQPGLLTKAFCGEASHDQDYLRLLNAVESYEREGDRLTLNLAGGKSSMFFSKLLAVTGMVSTEETTTLPDGSVLQVKVLDVSKAGAPAVQIGSALQEVRKLPARFEVTYKPSAVEPGNFYTVEASIIGKDGALLYRTTQLYYVLTKDNPTYGVEVMVEPIQ